MTRLAVAPDGQTGQPRRAFLWLAVAAAAAGCGRPGPKRRADRTEIKGTVTLDGQPLGGAVITIVSATDPDRVAGALVLADGSYHCDNVPAGEVIIGIENDSVRLPGGEALATLPPVPARYKNWKTSGLKAVATEKQTSIVPLDLKTKPAAR